MKQAVVMQPSVPRLIQRESAQLHPAAALAVVALALLAQVYLPLLLHVVSLFDLSLLVLVYLALSRRDVGAGLLLGAGIGLAQDGLTHGPVGVFGIIKTVIGYLAGSVSLVIEVGYPGARSVLAALFFLVHHFLFWTMERALLAGETPLNLSRTLLLAAAHAGVSLVIYPLLDRLKKAR